MKAARWFLLAVIAGVLVGGVAAWMRAADPGPAFTQFVAGKPALYFPPDPDAGKGVAKVALPEGLDHFFEVMPVGQTRSHRFPVKNTGTGPLRLMVRDTSCSCTVGELDKTEIAPGATTYVTLEWHSAKFAPDYKQTAIIGTNDPDRDELYFTVQGRIVPLVRADPADVTFADVPAGSARAMDTLVYGYADADLQVVGHQWVDDAVAQFFELEILPAPEMLAAEPNAKVAWRCRIKIKPGLPLGAFFQRLRLQMNEPEVPELEVMIRGTVVSDITITGLLFDKTRNLLTLDSIRRNESVQHHLNLFVKGDGHQDVALTVVDVQPADVLEVRLEEGRHLEPVSIHKLVVEIPENSSLVNHLGSPEHPWGKIELATTHPDLPRLVIHVRFAIIE